MKKFFTTLALALLTLAAFAQENPNRVIVKQKYKAPVGYLAERIDSIYFTKLEGRVAPDVKFLSFSKGNLTDTIRLAVTKTPECKSYKIACMPAGQANSFASDAALEQYFDQLEDCPTFTDDFTNATLTGLDMEFQSNAPIASSPWATTSTASPAPRRVPTSPPPTPTWWATRKSSTPSWR